MSKNTLKLPMTPEEAPIRPPAAEMHIPPPPKTLEETGLEIDDLRGLVLRFAEGVSGLTPESTSEALHLPVTLTADLLETLRKDKLVEVLGSAGPLTFRYAITDLGRDLARRVMEVCGYVGPAPVTLKTYRTVLQQQFDRLPAVTPDLVTSALADLVIPEEIVEVVGLACLSSRTLLLHGPAGNGKTEIGSHLHRALEGDIWIPYCIDVDGQAIRLFDPQIHERLSEVDAPPHDERWVRIKRPFVVVGGELTLDALELAYDPGLRCYEAPMHVKANGGTFLLDDFGHQRAEPNQLLGRWVYPLEHNIDHLTMRTGQKIEVPFRQRLIVSTNLVPEEVMDPAFLRRMGYRVHLGAPSEGVYGRIFERYAARCGASIEPGAIESLLERYSREGRHPRACEPRDLIERSRDLCQFRGRPFKLDAATLDRAWMGYFGDASESDYTR